MDVSGLTYNIADISYITAEASNGFDLLDLNQNERPLSVPVKHEKLDLSEQVITCHSEQRLTDKGLHMVDDVFLHLTSQAHSQGKRYSNKDIISVQIL